MIRTLVIEDEVHARSSLIKMLNIVAPNIEIVATSGFVKESIQLINEHKPDLLIMDIKLEDGNSFEILEAITTVDFQIIFTTAYDRFAVKAFKFSALDYLLKPISPTELQNAISKTEENIKKEKYYQERVNVLKNNLTGNEEKIVLKTTEQRYILKTKDIIRLEADTAYTVFHTADNSKITVSKNLKYYQDILGESFIRCHQSHLVNTEHIRGIHKNEALRMSNEILVPIASRKRKEISKLIQGV